MQQEPLILDRPTGPEIHQAGVIAQRRGRVSGHRFKECRICFGQHEEQIHDATLSVRQWFRGEVTKGFDVVFYE
jgi:hypothetical protein